MTCHAKVGWSMLCDQARCLSQLGSHVMKSQMQQCRWTRFCTHNLNPDSMVSQLCIRIYDTHERRCGINLETCRWNKTPTNRLWLAAFESTQRLCAFDSARCQSASRFLATAVSCIFESACGACGACDDVSMHSIKAKKGTHTHICREFRHVALQLLNEQILNWDELDSAHLWGMAPVAPIKAKLDHPQWYHKTWYRRVGALWSCGHLMLMIQRG